jgi:hypothetical protein
MAYELLSETVGDIASWNERAGDMSRFEAVAFHDGNPMDAGMPTGSGLQLDLEGEGAASPSGLRTGTDNDDVDSTAERGHAAFALVSVLVTGGIPVRQRPQRTRLRFPNAGLFAVLLSSAAEGLIDGREVRIDPQVQTEFGSGMLREIREFDIFVNTVRNVPRESQLKGILRTVCHLPTASILESRRKARWEHDVIAEPGMLLDVTQCYGKKHLIINEVLVARKKASFVDKQTLSPYR